ncbi:hypothetical protein TESS_TESS_00220 [Tessaracoccus sp. O5.2]|uniref:hypothetical protein n=1 Tax=Tessaracoccus sp. O5.2 TaxID=3157622 RepID=UPI0035EB693A
MATLHVDCTTCSARGAGCADCVISLLLGAPDDVGLEDEERSALAVLADAGLVPPLRLAGAAGSPGDTPVPLGVQPGVGRRIDEQFEKSLKRA